jgi:transcriptional regulator with XRE-family HTH domain
LDAESVDAIVCDPPYGLSFMGKDWDHGVPGEAFWREALRVAKPGAHLVAFGGTRTYHRLTCAIEDAGWEIRDCLSYLYGTGFPKSHDVSKAMDKHGGAPPSWFGPWFRAWRESNGITQKQVAALFPSKTGGLTGCVANWELGFNLPTPKQFNLIRDTFGLPFDTIEAAEREVVGRGTSGTTAIWSEGGMGDYTITAPATDLARQWQGWGTALKPAWEPVILARKPLIGTVAANVAQYGTGGINVDGCRIGTDDVITNHSRSADAAISKGKYGHSSAQDTHQTEGQRLGRWPANVVLDEEAAGLLDAQTGTLTSGANPTRRASGMGYHGAEGQAQCDAPRGVDSGGASRFFYTAKASRKEREAGLEGMPVGQPVGGADKWTETDRRRGEGVTREPAANVHPTVKPIALMRWLCRLVTPKGGLILDPFTGSGTTGCAAVLEGFRFVGVEREPEYAAIAEKRIAHWAAQTPDADLFTEAL